MVGSLCKRNSRLHGAFLAVGQTVSGYAAYGLQMCLFGGGIGWCAKVSIRGGIGQKWRLGTDNK
ncbi:hypothetical protein [Paenibacillus lignilyticus]|uniref:Uncharacterized protein n=1 Tax=Paenibacillus lignilyticus TaxID=1172615 RepID=A0ABS5CKC5_9BACL|nr:hypothetical protein [Paenibacillus lignilyticus]MBP3966317.1 hypothetical protein [Paenibacillus lignilyticus]